VGPGVPLAVISTTVACGPVPMHVAAVRVSAVPNVDDNSRSSASSILEEVMALVVGSMTAGEHSVSVLNRAVPSSDKEKVSDSAVRQPASRRDGASAEATILFGGDGVRAGSMFTPRGVVIACGGAGVGAPHHPTPGSCAWWWAALGVQPGRSCQSR